MAKTPISIRLETDLLNWFKHVAPQGYQVMIQDILRDYRRAREHRAEPSKFLRSITRSVSGTCAKI
jgi:hypothetical protein